MAFSFSAIPESANASPIVAGLNATDRPNIELALRKQRRDLSSGSFIGVLLSSISPSEMRWIRLILGVPPLHFIEFLGRDLRQVPDEQHQAPGLRDSVRSVEGWHAAQTNSIFNCVVELAIALVLRPGCAQVGRFRIEALAEYRLARSVIPMARGAMIGEMLDASPNVLR